jgi:hypothetical protein
MVNNQAQQNIYIFAELKKDIAAVWLDRSGGSHRGDRGLCITFCREDC